MAKVLGEPKTPRMFGTPAVACVSEFTVGAIGRLGWDVFVVVAWGWTPALLRLQAVSMDMKTTKMDLRIFIPNFTWLLFSVVPEIASYNSEMSASIAGMNNLLKSSLASLDDLVPTNFSL